MLINDFFSKMFMTIGEVKIQVLGEIGRLESKEFFEELRITITNLTNKRQICCMDLNCNYVDKLLDRKNLSQRKIRHF